MDVVISPVSSKGSDRQIQLAITAQKSVSLHFEGAGRDSQIYSKELYLWSQDQPEEDIKDGRRGCVLRFLVMLN